VLPEEDADLIAAAAPGEAHDDDEFALTDGYETASTGSTSVTSSVYAHTVENGRRYQHFKNGRYPIPNDDEELNREDMKHAMLMELCDGELFYAPVGENVHKILDVGTGTGEWATPSINQSINWVSAADDSELTVRGTWQACGRLKSATGFRTRVSGGSTCRLRSPCGCRQMSIFSSTTANRASGSTRMSISFTSGS
jgi:hypothetical protein